MLLCCWERFNTSYYKSILCKFGRICATGNYLALLATISSEFSSFCCWKQFYESLDGSVQREMLLCCWKQFHPSLNGSVQKEMFLYCLKRFYASLHRSVQQEMLLCCWKQFYASLDESVWQEKLSWEKMLEGTPLWKSPPNLEEECAVYVVMTHHTAEANQGKVSSRPTEATHTESCWNLVLILPISPNPWTPPVRPPRPATPLSSYC